MSLAMNTTRPEARLALLDAGRFGAAAAVLVYHYFFNGIANGKLSSLSAVPGLSEVARYGYLGVEFFFLISGYVILVSARGRSARDFAVARALRLYPAFLAAMLLTALLAQAWGGTRMAVTLPQVAANLTMAAPWFGHEHVDGVYWTLAYELRFYAVVLLALLLGAGARLEGWAVAWVVAQLAAHLMGLARVPLLGGYYVFFAAGALFAALQRGALRGALAWALVGAALYLCLDMALGEARAKALATGMAFSPLVVAGAIGGFFAFFAALGQARVRALEIPGARWAGALTYPLYLVHAHVGYMLLSRFGSEEHKALAYAAVIALVLGLALVLHLGVERALAPWWRRGFERALGAPLQAVERSARRWLQPGRA
jgi:peptidoglycan/LPS O-acetylase OafA/YrhL